jgi:hypothetical protein
MAKYFQVAVELHTDNGKGGTKKVTEQYLVDAQSVTEAEARVVKEFEASNIQLEYNIKGATQSKIVEVFE